MAMNLSYSPASRALPSKRFLVLIPVKVNTGTIVLKELGKLENPLTSCRVERVTFFG
jgi:hypothetical protein